jgi:putative ATP-dependent endonuclease of OLD family
VLDIQIRKWVKIMGMRLSKLRIKNFRSLESFELELTDNNLLIGQNNCGKSNVLRAINIALNSTSSVSEQDIYVESGEVLSKDKKCIIDIMLRPVNQNGKFEEDFSDFWIQTFTDKWITIDDACGNYVGIRTTIEYDAKFDQYCVTKRQIKQWNNDIESANCGKKQGYTSDMQSYIFAFYMDAQRDILDDLKNKKSYFGRSTSSRDIPHDVIEDIESSLSEINSKLIDNVSTLKDAQESISEIGTVLGNHQSELYIEPIGRTINDLNRGMDIKYTEENGPALSVSEQGMGTRSWISFLTLGAYVNYLLKNLKKEEEDAELFVVLTLEEPEAHLHSYAQKKLFNQIKKFPGQKIITTHSSNVLTQASVIDFVHLYKSKGKTIAKRINSNNYSSKEIEKIQREFIRNKGELLFSTGVVLAEGLTEEIALPVFYQKYFQMDPNASGIAIIGIGGKNYKSFVRLLNDFGIPWFIFSDGEPDTIHTVEKALEEVFHDDISKHKNVILIDSGDDYEKHLIKCGYDKYMIDAINEQESELVESKESNKTDSATFFDRCIEINKNAISGLKSTGKKCPTCGQLIKQKELNNYDGVEGRKRALLDCCQKNNGKVKYAYSIAKKIVDSAPSNSYIPKKVMELFKEIEKMLKEGNIYEN